jgi:hypothetical protein
MDVCRPRRHILTKSVAPAKSIPARAANLFYLRRCGRRTSIILYSLLFCINYCPDPAYEGKKLNFL